MQQKTEIRCRPVRRRNRQEHVPRLSARLWSARSPQRCAERGGRRTARYWNPVGTRPIALVPRHATMVARPGHHEREALGEHFREAVLPVEGGTLLVDRFDEPGSNTDLLTGGERAEPAVGKHRCRAPGPPSAGRPPGGQSGIRGLGSGGRCHGSPISAASVCSTGPATRVWEPATRSSGSGRVPPARRPHFHRRAIVVMPAASARAGPGWRRTRPPPGSYRSR